MKIKESKTLIQLSMTPKQFLTLLHLIDLGLQDIDFGTDAYTTHEGYHMKKISPSRYARDASAFIKSLAEAKEIK